MLKKYIAVVLVCIMLLASSFVPGTVLAQNEKTEIFTLSAKADIYGDYEYSVAGSNATVKKYRGSDVNVQIPEKINGYNVTKIGTSAFAESNIVSVAIPEGVTDIDWYAFENCPQLKTVVIPASLKNIGAYAFDKSAAIGNVVFTGTSDEWEAVTVATGNTNLTSCASTYCLKSYCEKYGKCGDNVYWFLKDGKFSVVGSGDVYSYKFDYNLPWNKLFDKIKTAVISEGITGIGSIWFRYCNYMTSVSIPDTVTYIGESAFNCCLSLTSVTIPAGVTSIGKYAFRNCRDLNSITVKKGNTAYKCVDNCLIEIATKKLIRGCGDSVIPTDGSVEIIDDYAFGYCENLKVLNIPKSVKSIGYEAFYSCSGLTSINVEAGNPVYHSDGNCLITTASKLLIRGCINSTIPEDGSVTEINVDAFDSCTGLTEIEIPYGVTDICTEAFAYCTDLQTVYLPSSIAYIGDSAFEECTELEDVYYNGTFEEWNTVDNNDTSDYFFGASMHYAEYGEDETGKCGDNANWYLNDGVLKIKGTGDIYDWSFPYNVPWYSSCNDIKHIVIYNGITGIGYLSFQYCENLISVVIPDSVTEIGDDAFRNCQSLTEITIPSGVTSIGEQAFKNCGSLTSITVGDENETYHSSGNCLIETASKTLICGCKNSVIPTDGSVEKIANYAFSCCGGLTEIYIPKCIKSIADHAFSACSDVTSIKVESGNAFYHSSGNCLIETASKKLIRGCRNSVIPADGSVTEICDDSFDSCSWLTEIVIPYGVEVIGECAFDYCEELTSVTIASSVTEIDVSAFDGCSSLTDIYYGGSEADWWYKIDFEGRTEEFWGFLDKISEEETITLHCDSDEYIASVALSASSYSYTGTVKKPSVTVKNGSGTVLTPDTDYSVVYSNVSSKYPGSYTVTVTGKGNYSNTVTASYVINKQTLDSSKITLSGSSYTYTSFVKKPTVTVKNSSGSTLTNGASYTVKYCCSAGCKAVGTHKVTITGKGNYSGTVTKTFKIVKQPLDASRITLSYSSCTFNNTVKAPVVAVKSSQGTTLTNGGSYTVKYCCSAGCKAVGTHMVTITGKGNYTGTVTKTFKIVKQPLDASRITLSYSSCTYTAAVKKPTVTVKSSQGTTLTNGGSYTVTYCCANGCKTAGTHKVTITGKGNYTGTVTKTFTINKQTVIPARVTLSATSFTYDGTAKKPTVTVKTIQGTTLTKGTSYTVNYCCSDGCKTKGTHKVTVTAVGSNYTGTVIKEFTIK